MTRRLLPCLLCALTACSPEPAWYPLPMQRVFDPSSEPKVVGAIVSMDSPHVDNYIVSGIITREPGSSWRWANEKAQLRFAIGEAQRMKFIADFVIADDTFKVTGPVTMKFTIDGRPIGAERYDKPGEKHYEVEVAPAVLRSGEPMTVSAEVDKYFESKTDGVKLGFLLIRMGFTQ
ncbi:MAG: hypothetical protein JNK48_12780 [Bryobacterales bacterium]|nr:hypothetical protein [Bryobacterales bacterium]